MDWISAGLLARKGWKVDSRNIAMLNVGQTPATQTFVYPYEEFSAHIKAMRMVQNWEYTSRFGHIGHSQTSRANNARVLDYFSDCYVNQDEAVRKAELFLSINDYIARNAALFSRKDLLERENNSFSVDPALLRAVHFIFTVAANPGELAPKSVLNLAKAFKQVSPQV